MTIWRMCILCWVTKATDTHSEYVILIPLHCSNGFKNVPQCYVTRALPSCCVLLVTHAHFVCGPAILGSTSGSDPIQLRHLFPPMFLLLLCIIIPNPVLHTGIWLFSNIICWYLYLQVCNMNQSSSIKPLSYRFPVRERYGSTLLPATREQHDQNCTQSH